MIRCLIFIILNFFAFSAAYGALAGGRPNAFSEGQNAFAGVVNPANAVWIDDRFDLGVFWIHQRSSLINHDNNPFFLSGKIDLTYKSKDLFTMDVAIHKKTTIKACSKTFDSSWSLAAYSMPSFAKLRTKEPIPIAGTTPITIFNKIDVISLVFSIKLHPSHSIGYSIDYFYFSHRRNGFQKSDNCLRSVSPGHVTNNGEDHSEGLGLSVGWRWNISKRLNFGAAWSRKSYCGQFRKYRGFNPYHAENYIPQTLGAGFSYRLTKRFAGRFEVLWSNTGNLPGANNNILSDGKLNLNKRGSSKSPGPGLRDATFLNIGIGYLMNEWLSLGASFSHRLKFRKSSNFLSHTYRLQTIYDVLSFGANLNYYKHDFFISISYGFRNKVSGFMPIEVGGGEFSCNKQNVSLSISWGYRF